MGSLVCCANEPFARGLPCGKRARCSSPVEMPNRLRASSFRMQARGFLLQQICDREQIETVEHSATGVRQLLDAALIEELAWSFPYSWNRTRRSFEHVCVPASHTRYVY